MDNLLRRRKVDTHLEHNILTGLIVSDRFTRDIQPIIKQVLKTTRTLFDNDYANIIARWCLDYYKQYQQVPAGHIQDLFNSEKQRMKKEDADIISDFLHSLSEQYTAMTEQQEGTITDAINVDYLMDKAVDYFKLRALKYTGEQLQALAELGKVKEAEQQLTEFSKVEKATAKFVNPIEHSQVAKYFHDETNKTNILFKMPGVLGDLMGELQRGCLLAVVAPAKRGKTFWLQEIVLQALLNGYKALFISLEMDAHRMKRRIYRRLTATGDRAGGHIYPCWDCLVNQYNICSKPQRINKIKLRDPEEGKPEFNIKSEYRPCCVCRGSKTYKVQTWFEIINQPRMKYTPTAHKLEEQKRMLRDNFRFGCYPAFSANLTQIRHDIEQMEYFENFLPDVIAIDYADILAPEDSRQTGRDRIDETWKAFKGLASAKYCLIATASQSNRKSFDKKNVTQIDIAEDIRKIAHLDLGIVINQTPQEKRASISRIAVIAGRDDDFDQYQSAIVLQQLSLGQVMLDSERAGFIGDD